MSPSIIFFGAALACILGVAVTLFRGLFAMTRGQSRPGNRLMRVRIGLQALAIVFLLLAYLAQ